jgi:hypothetical protein
LSFNFKSIEDLKNTLLNETNKREIWKELSDILFYEKNPVITNISKEIFD